jgi:hypothetical protein
MNEEFLNDLIRTPIDESEKIKARKIGPETIYTQDIQQDRLNIEYDKDNLITGWYYG